MQRVEESRLSTIIATASSNCLKPLCFFVSWQGVLTLAYSGFPLGLIKLKADIEQELPSIPKENPGSMWPKTTLAPLKDGKRLTPQQLKALNQLCRSKSEELSLCSEALHAPVRSAAVAVYLCRSLEKLLLLQEVPMAYKGEAGAARSSATGDRQKDASWPSRSMILGPELETNPDLGVAPDELRRVERIVAEADNEDYWFAASRDGNRETHYRGNSFGCTVMIPLGRYVQEERAYAPQHLFTAIQHFQNSVEELFPGLYTWLAPASYHVTLRAIH